MGLDEFMMAVMEWSLDEELELLLDDEDYEMMDYSVRSVVKQMGWSNDVRYVIDGDEDVL